MPGSNLSSSYVPSRLAYLSFRIPYSKTVRKVRKTRQKLLRNHFLIISLSLFSVECWHHVTRGHVNFRQNFFFRKLPSSFAVILAGKEKQFLDFKHIWNIVGVFLFLAKNGQFSIFQFQPLAQMLFSGGYESQKQLFCQTWILKSHDQFVT